VMVTRPQAELGEDRQVLRTIVRHANQNVGVYANVRVTGSVRAGDTATLS
jgi:uncharacterized protein